MVIRMLRELKENYISMKIGIKLRVRIRWE